jgi:Tol biopolymer transport system component/DNA-binding winged helix-turn-helix (wHTH) protein
LPPELRFGEFEVDRAAELLRRHGEVVHLEPRSFRLLVHLLDHRDRLVTKQDLNESVWDGAFVTDNAVDRAVARLRRALGDDVHQPRFVETVPTRGYRFIAQVEGEAPGAAEPAVVDSAALARAAAAPAAVESAAEAPTGVAPARRRHLPAAAILVVVGLVLLGMALIALRSRDAALRRGAAAGPERVLARQITSSDAYEFAPSFSADGSSLAYTSSSSGKFSLWIRSLSPGGRDRELGETAGARAAAWSPDGRFIAYDSYQGIWIVPPDGGSPRQLTERGGTPKWSPDGTTIVFQSGVEGVDINSWAARPPSTIWRVGLDGEPPRQITQQDEPPGGHGQPAFSPDGGRIVFVTTAFGLATELWTVSASGGDLRRVLTGCQCRDPIFSKDGARIYYDDYVDSLHGLWEVDVAGGQTRRLIYEAPLRFPSLAPDGRRLVASRHHLESELWAVSVAPETGVPTGEAAPLTLENVDRNQFPSASPDGSRLAFLVTRAGNLRELWIVPSAGGSPEMLVSGGLGGWPAWSTDSRRLYFVNDDALQSIDIETRRLDTVLRTDLDWQTPAVAPGGSAVAFTLTDGAGVSNVWMLEPDGAPRQVTHETTDTNYPTWSPDGRWIAVEVVRDRGYQIGYVSAGGGVPTLLTEGRTQCFTGGWSPDGDKIVFARRPIESPVEHWNLWWVSRSTREQRQITDRAQPSAKEFLRYPSWSATGDRIYFELAQSRADLWLFELPVTP